MTDATAVDAAPDWGTFAATLSCPLCGYDLRGLTTPRCPECGFAFTWAELLDVGRGRHPWLFEHGTGRNARTFLSTYRRTCRPWRFWRAVTPAHVIRVRRLVLYWLLAGLPAVAIVVFAWGTNVVAVAREYLAMRAYYKPLFATPASLDQIYPSPWSFRFVEQVWDVMGKRGWFKRADRTRVAAAVVVVAWPWLSFVALSLFRWSMRRAQVRPAHVLRAAVYGCDFGPLMVVAVLGYYGLMAAWPALASRVDFAFRSPVFPADAGLLVFVVLACAAVATHRLTAAYAAYLRFHLPLPTVLAAQAVAVVLAAAVLFATMMSL